MTTSFLLLFQVFFLLFSFLWGKRISILTLFTSIKHALLQVQIDTQHGNERVPKKRKKKKVSFVRLSSMNLPMWTLSMIWTYIVLSMFLAVLETIPPNNRLFMYANEQLFITVYRAVHSNIDWKFTLMEKLNDEWSEQREKKRIISWIELWKSHSSWKIDLEW